MKLALLLIEGVVTELASREEAPLLDGFIMVALVTLDRSLVQISCVFFIFSKVFDRQRCYHAPPAIHQRTETDP